MSNAKALSHYQDESPFSPYVIISYRYNPASTIGEYISQKTSYKSTRGKRSVTSLKQKFDVEAQLSDYARYIRRFDNIFHGINNVSKIRSIPDTFVIIVGVVDKSALHEGVYGDSIEYAKLFRLLAGLGYDPLRPIRKRQKTVSDELGTEIRRKITSGGLSKDVLVDAANLIARRLKNEVRDYIFGGSKPRLKESTVDVWRPTKKSVFPELYGGASGIYEPLFESGQLFDAIDCDVFAFQSEEMRQFSSQLVEEANAIREERRRTEMFKTRLHRIRGEKSVLAFEQMKSKVLLKPFAEGVFSRRGMELTKPRLDALLFAMRNNLTLFRGFEMVSIPKNPTKRQQNKIEGLLRKYLGLTEYVDKHGNVILRGKSVDASSAFDYQTKEMSDRDSTTSNDDKSEESISKYTKAAKPDYISQSSADYESQMLDIAHHFSDIIGRGATDEEILREIPNYANLRTSSGIPSVQDVRLSIIAGFYLATHGRGIS